MKKKNLIALVGLFSSQIALAAPNVLGNNAKVCYKSDDPNDTKVEAVYFNEYFEWRRTTNLQIDTSDLTGNYELDLEILVNRLSGIDDSRKERLLKEIPIFLNMVKFSKFIDFKKENIKDVTIDTENNHFCYLEQISQWNYNRSIDLKTKIIIDNSLFNAMEYSDRVGLLLQELISGEVYQKFNNKFLSEYEKDEFRSKMKSYGHLNGYIASNQLKHIKVTEYIKMLLENSIINNKDTFNLGSGEYNFFNFNGRSFAQKVGYWPQGLDESLGSYYIDYDIDNNKEKETYIIGAYTRNIGNLEARIGFTNLVSLKSLTSDKLDFNFQGMMKVTNGDKSFQFRTRTQKEIDEASNGPFMNYFDDVPKVTNVKINNNGLEIERSYCSFELYNELPGEMSCEKFVLDENLNVVKSKVYLNAGNGILGNFVIHHTDVGSHYSNIPHPFLEIINNKILLRGFTVGYKKGSFYSTVGGNEIIKNAYFNVSDESFDVEYIRKGGFDYYNVKVDKNLNINTFPEVLKIKSGQCELNLKNAKKRNNSIKLLEANIVDIKNCKNVEMNRKVRRIYKKGGKLLINLTHRQGIVLETL